MKTTKIKEGFFAYEEIQDLANKAFAPVKVSTQASIFGDDYNIYDDATGKSLLKGTSRDVRMLLIIEEGRIK